MLAVALATLGRHTAFALGVAFFAVGAATALVGALILGLRLIRYGAEAVRPRTRIEE